MRARARIGLLAALLAALAAVSCKQSAPPVIVLAAASLARAFADVEELLEQDGAAGLDVQLEISGSQIACRKISELHRRADIVAVADHRLIDRMLRPRHARFNLRLATNELVIAHHEHSRYTEVITADNWPSILLRPGVALGTVEPDLAPIGYHTVLLWRLAAQLGAGGATGDLAARLRARCRPEHVAPHEGELLQLLQARAIDYAFVYRSTAEEHNLKVVTLPDEYNLGAAQHAARYARTSVAVRIDGQRRQQIRGGPILYGLTIPTAAPNPAGAARFVAQLLGDDGRRALARTGFRPLRPAPCDGCAAAPPALRPLTR